MLVVDDSAAARAAIAEVVRSTDGFKLVGTAASGQEALLAMPALEPDLVLLDVRMGGLDGHETSRLISMRARPTVLVLVSALTASELPPGVESCGAAAVLHKSEMSPRRLRELWRSLQEDGAGRRPAATQIASWGDATS